MIKQKSKVDFTSQWHTHQKYLTSDFHSKSLIIPVLCKTMLWADWPEEHKAPSSNAHIHSTGESKEFSGTHYQFVNTDKEPVEKSILNTQLCKPFLPPCLYY